jgi:hypothetical protein
MGRILTLRTCYSGPTVRNFRTLYAVPTQSVQIGTPSIDQGSCAVFTPNAIQRFTAFVEPPCRRQAQQKPSLETIIMSIPTSRSPGLESYPLVDARPPSAGYMLKQPIDGIRASQSIAGL